MHKHILHPTLYSPATLPAEKLAADLLYNLRFAVWRLVVCTEDSIREHEVPNGIANIAALLPLIQPSSHKAVFVRVRNPEVLDKVLDLPEVAKLEGFVIPKADPTTFAAYADKIIAHGHSGFRLMPILESPLMNDPHFRNELRAVLSDERYRPLIDCLRIGANDLMGHLGIRRDTRDLTVYDTPIGATIYSIINEFRGLSGFTITAPVFECFDKRYDDLLRTEVRRNILNNLFGQTVIHPRHLRIIRDMYSVEAAALKSATNMLESEAAVNGVDGRMDEYATHVQWARMITHRNELFGSTRSDEAFAAHSPL